MSHDPNPAAFTVEGEGGIPINVFDYGGEGPPLVLCHCTGTHARVWDPLVPALRDRFHVYAPDTRGHGDSYTPEDPDAYTWAKSGVDTQRVIEHIAGGEPVFAAGHSAGGAHVAYVGFNTPALLHKAVLIDAIIGPRHAFEGESPLAKLAKRRINTFESRAAAKERFASKPPMSTWSPEALDAYIDHAFRDDAEGTVTLKCLGPIEAHVYNRGGASDLFERLGELETPVMLVTGEQSNVRQLVEAQRQLLPSAPFIDFPQTTHFIPQERPAEVAQLIRDFLI